MDKTQEEFLKDLEPSNETEVLEQSLDVPKPDDTTTEETETDKFNRRERRLRDKLQSERESSIALAARLEALTEAQKFSRDTVISSYEEKAMRIYGTDTPEAKAATDLLITSLKEVKESATKEALETFREEQRKEKEAVKNEEKTLDAMVEDIEDTFNVTLSDATQKGFFKLLEKLSPKDSNGDVIQYADPHAVWEELQARKQAGQQPNRAKDLASRGINRTGGSPSTTVEDDTTERYLKEQGII